jgi:putative FmdB family regulatory protein
VPVYAFSCERCGPFDVWRPLSEATRRAHCPTCRKPGRRVYTPPGLVKTPAPVRKAREFEEKSAHEPEVAREPQGRPLPFARHGHRNPPWVAGH